MKIASLLARVSTNRQEKEATIESQIAEVEERIKTDGNVLGEGLKFVDDGWSGDILARPGLDAMRDAAAKKIFQILYVWDRDRIARKYSYQELVLDELEELGIEVVDLHNAHIENPEDKILMGFKGLFAEYEKVKIAERMRRGKLFKAKLGKYVNLQAPYGYIYVAKTKDSDPYLLINEEEAEVVRIIFGWIGNEGLTLRAVIRRLHEQKIYPRKRQRDFWGQGPICRLVRNESYIGKSFYNKSFAKVPITPKNNDQYRRVKKTSRGRRPREEWYEIKVPAILDKGLFRKVQEQLKLNQRFNPRNRKAPYLLTSIVYCICGRRRIGEGVRHHRYYRCTDAIYRFPFPRECGASGVNAFHLDDMVWHKISQILSNRELVAEYAGKVMVDKSRKEKSAKTLEVNRKALLERIGVEEKRYVKAYGAGLLNLSQFKERTEELRNRKANILSDMEQDRKHDNVPVLDLTKVRGWSKKVTDILASYDLDQRRELLRKVITGVTVGDSNNVAIKGRIFLGKEAQNVGYWSICRDSWFA